MLCVFWRIPKNGQNVPWRCSPCAPPSCQNFPAISSILATELLKKEKMETAILTLARQLRHLKASVEFQCSHDQSAPRQHLHVCRPCQMAVRTRDSVPSSLDQPCRAAERKGPKTYTGKGRSVPLRKDPKSARLAPSNAGPPRVSLMK